jgi:hypothetical protein
MASIKLQDISQCSQNETIHFLKNIQATPNPLPYILPRKEFTMGIWGWGPEGGRLHIPACNLAKGGRGQESAKFLTKFTFWAISMMIKPCDS